MLSLLRADGVSRYRLRTRPRSKVQLIRWKSSEKTSLTGMSDRPVSATVSLARPFSRSGSQPLAVHPGASANERVDILSRS